MAYQIIFKTRIRKDLAKIDRHQAGRLLLAVIEILSVSPETQKPLKGRYAGLRRMRFGDYRVIYEIIAETVIVLHIAHRKNERDQGRSSGRR